MLEFLFGKKPKLEDLSLYETEAREALDRFKDKYKKETRQVSGIEMSWYDSKSDQDVVVLFPGTTGKAEVWYEYALELEKDKRVVLLDFPEVETIQGFSESVSDLFSLLSIDKATIVGQSFGGVLAQCFADQYPQCVSKLVLITSFSNTQVVTDKTRKNYVKSLSRFVKALGDLKFESLQKSIYKQVLRGVDVAHVDNKAFWKAYYGNMLLNSSPTLLEAVHKIQIDFWNQIQSNLGVYNKNILLVEAKTDASYDREEKKALLKRYPKASVFEIAGSSNLSHIREKEAIVKKILDKKS
ncbi:alpha/beta fold hydrolase [Fusibacter sp. JL216-2]|uniref:alpha/beta fold hydrolase n=1 Tax=Fusibacter sp. JL216-2 TaxID=3071453 RepID=UPI003D330BB5